MIENYNRDDEMEETARDNIRKNKENLLKQIFNFFSSEEEYKKILKKLEITKEISMDIFKELLEKEIKIVKNKKELNTENDYYSQNRNFFSEFKKIETDKDTSNLEYELIKMIYGSEAKRIAVDYRSNFYIDGKKILNFKEVEKREYKIFYFLIELEESLNSLSEEDEEKRVKIFLGIDLNTEYDTNCKEIEKRIKCESDEKKRFCMYLLAFFHIYYLINVKNSMIGFLEELLKRDVYIPTEYRINNNVETKAELLEKIRFKEKSKKDNLADEKFKSIEIFYINSSPNEEIREIPSEIRDQVLAAYYRGVYLAEQKYKGRKLNSYLEGYRKGEFILTISEILQDPRFSLDVLENIIERYLTKKEIKNIFNDKKEVEIKKEMFDPYSIEEEEKYVNLIIKSIMNERKEIIINDEIIRKLEEICQNYIKYKKKYGDFEEGVGMKRDIINIINYTITYYFEANLGKEEKWNGLFRQMKEYEIKTIEELKKYSYLDSYIL